MKGDQHTEGARLPYEAPRLERVGSLLNLLGKTGITFEFGGEKRIEPPAPLGGNLLEQPGVPHGHDGGGGDGHGH